MKSAGSFLSAISIRDSFDYGSKIKEKWIREPSQNVNMIRPVRTLDGSVLCRSSNSGIIFSKALDSGFSAIVDLDLCGWPVHNNGVHRECKTD